MRRWQCGQIQFFHGVRCEMLPTLAWLEKIASVLTNRRVDSIDQLEPAGQHATCIGQKRNTLTHDVQAGHLTNTIEPLQHDARDLRVSPPWASNQPNLSHERLRTALRNPNPPLLRTTTSWCSAQMSPLAPQRSDSDTPRRHDCEVQNQIGPNRSQPMNGPGGNAKEQEDQSRQHVTYQMRSKSVWCSVTLLINFALMSSSCPTGDPNTTTHDCFWVQGKGNSGEILASSGCGPTAVPELRLSAVHAYSGVDPQCVLDQTENLQQPLWFADKIHVVPK